MMQMENAFSRARSFFYPDLEKRYILPAPTLQIEQRQQ
jgi:hypothetical protein